MAAAISPSNTSVTATSASSNSANDHLGNDPSEKTNLASQRPDLAAKAAAYMKAAHAPSWEPKWNF
jgi:hypothetical protein